MHSCPIKSKPGAVPCHSSKRSEKFSAGSGVTLFAERVSQKVTATAAITARAACVHLYRCHLMMEAALPLEAGPGAGAATEVPGLGAESGDDVLSL